MRRSVGLTLLLAAGITSAALAAKPKPMDCDAWSCGDKCAPAKYEAVRSYWMPPWLLTSPLYGAAVIESAAIGAVLIVGRVAKRRRGPSLEAPVRDPLAGEPGP